jgi:hypothetical protein
MQSVVRISTVTPALCMAARNGSAKPDWPRAQLWQSVMIIPAFLPVGAALCKAAPSGLRPPRKAAA